MKDKKPEDTTLKVAEMMKAVGCIIMLLPIAILLIYILWNVIL